ncbi:hypothetical protein LCGC14_1706620 [marine sediment metagenome]|uniref:site-specific DNA-methyltransferase (cytosine-N(4)-specific) n=1 Tax=marine sediment metagenome TaxID=412755 RepID=A0A0F9HGX0_9ZZZZ
MNKIILGDCIEELKKLPDESVNCVMTSPPYWALRDYGSTVETIWDIDEYCDYCGSTGIDPQDDNNEAQCPDCNITCDHNWNSETKVWHGDRGKGKDKEIFTVEGLGTRENPHPVQKTYATNGAAQCGFCIPGQIVSAVALLEKNPNPSVDEIKSALDGNICRCTGYVKQIEAIQQAAKIIQEGKK